MKKIFTLSACIILFIASDAQAQWTKTGSNIYPTTLSDRVGIGTASPAFQFHVRGSGIQTFEVESTDNQVAWSLDNTGTNGKTIRFRTSGATKGAIQMPGNTEHITFQTGGVTERLRITSTGEIGIGTTSPTELLDVAGGVRVGFSSNNNAGTIRWTGTQMEYNDGSSWNPFGGTGDNWGTQTVASDSSLAGDGTAGDPLKLAIISDATLSGVGTAGDPLKMAAQGAGSGDILKFDGASWLPGALDIDEFVNNMPLVTDTVVRIIDANPGLGLEVVKANAMGSAVWLHTDDPANTEHVLKVDHFFDGPAASFQCLDPANTVDVVNIIQDGMGGMLKLENTVAAMGPAIGIANMGAGNAIGIAHASTTTSAMVVHTTDPSAVAPVIYVKNDGVTEGILIENSGPLNTEPAITAVKFSDGDCGLFIIDDVSNADNAVLGSTNGTGSAVRATSTGSGRGITATSTSAMESTVFIENTAADVTADILEVRGKTSDSSDGGTYLFSVTNLTSSLNNAAFIGGQMKVAGDATFDREITVAGSIFSEGLVLSKDLTSPKVTTDTIVSPLACLDFIKTDKIQVGSTAPAGSEIMRLDDLARMDKIQIGSTAVGAGELVHISGGSVVVDEEIVATELRVGSVAIPTGYVVGVDGKMVAEELLIKNSDNWPDYVFESDYELMSIENLKSTIEEQGHLPGVPSAEKIESDGIEIGEMQKILMKKIEELTLYVIELNDENKELRSKIDELNSK